MLRRRDLFGMMAGVLATAALPSPAHASRAISVTLDDLLRRSRCAALVSVLGGQSRWETVGTSRRIVTYSQLTVDELVAGEADEPVLTVRTLGGRVGRIGQVVHGAAVLVRGHEALVFLRQLGANVHAVTGMAQGHFPVLRDAAGARRLTSSPRRADVVERPGSAARALLGKPVDEATNLVREAARRAR